MKIKYLLNSAILFFIFFVSHRAMAQAPVANFSMSPNPACTNAGNGIQITDLSTNSPTAWSYTVAIFGPGPGGSAVFTSQNPFATFNFPGTYTITLVATNASGQSVPFTQTISVLRSPDANITPANANSCIGGSPININLTPAGPGGASYTYNWSTGQTTTSITVSPNVTTTYSCVITATNGCTTMKTSTITIGQPTVTINSSPLTICPGSSSTLTAMITGPAPHNYVWSTSSTSNSITTSAAGVYTVTATNGLNCTNTQTYSLVSSPNLSLTATATPTAICVGNSSLLHVTGASTYTWSNGINMVNNMVSPLTTTTYSVIGTFGTCSGTAMVSVMVSQIPTLSVLSSTGTICSGNSVLLFANGASNYTWNPGAIISPSISVSPTADMTYSVRGQNPGCPVRGTTVTIGVLQSPTVGITSTSSVICAGEQLALAANGANTYVWNDGSLISVTLISPTVTTTYSVVGTALNTCTASAVFVQTVDKCTSLNEINAAKFNIYPNPAAGVFTIRSGGDMEIRIINQVGSLVRYLKLEGKNDNEVSISGLSKGIYFVIGQNEKTTVTQKLILGD